MCRMDEVGFWKKKGCLGRALLSSAIWSLVVDECQPPCQTWERNSGE